MGFSVPLAFVAQAALRGQDAGAYIGAVDGSKGQRHGRHDPCNGFVLGIHASGSACRRGQVAWR
jgi:hypothetical protein